MRSKQFLTLIFACITCLFSTAQDGNRSGNEQCEKEASCAKPKGADLSAALAGWKGSYSRNGTVYNVSMDVKRKDGDLISVLSIPQLGIVNQECKLSVCGGQEIHLTPRGSAENLTITITTINAGVLKGRVCYEEKERSKQYALSMNVITKI